MAVTMCHRFDQDKTTLRQLIRSGRLGRVNTVSCRYASDMREHMAWGALFRHTMQDPLMIEGAVHHLDLVADLAGAPCRTSMRARGGRPGRATPGDTDGIVVMTFENGVRGVYEGSSTTAVGLNDWNREYVRVDCELGTAILNSREIEVFTRNDLIASGAAKARARSAAARAGEMAEHLADRAVLPWLDGGPAMETAVDANVRPRR